METKKRENRASHVHLRTLWLSMGFPNSSVGKESAYNTRDFGYLHLIPPSGRSPGVENGSYSSVLAMEISWTEKPGRLSSMGLPRVSHN